MPPHSTSPPSHWAGILSAPQWHVGAHAIGEARLDELRDLLAAVSERFRAAFLLHLVRTSRGRPAGAAVLLALALAAHDVGNGAPA